MKNAYIVILLLLVFIGGTVVGAATTTYKQETLSGETVEYKVIGSTTKWDLLEPKDGEGETVSLGNNGKVKVTVIDNETVLYVLTWKEGNPIYEGRLIDFGNDGTIEVANITGGQCSQPQQ